MFFDLKMHSLSIILNCVFAFQFVHSDEVPTMMWNIKGDSLPLKPVSALGHSDKILHESVKDALHQDANILVLAVSKLSLEDFYSKKSEAQNNTLKQIESFLDSEPHMLLPSTKDPLLFIQKTHCGVEEIVVNDKIDDIVLKAVDKAMQKSCVTVLYVSDEGLVTETDSLKKVLMPSFDKSKKNIIGIFTGVTSSWVGSDGTHHIFRNLLQAEAPANPNFINYTGCIIMYAENATIKIGKENGTLQFPPSTDGSSCGNSSILQLTFGASGSFTSVTLKFEFVKKMGSWKTVGTLTTEGNTDPKDNLKLDSGFIGAPVGFSYSCGKLVIKGKNASDVAIVMDRFQIQPFDVKKAFSESFDCVSFFTIPIWMGVVVALIFIVILNIGIYALFSVHTMDRFDDPKGKTISVAATAD